jgi:hypothetical protein
MPLVFDALGDLRDQAVIHQGEFVTTLYAFIAPGEISSKHDPMRVLKFDTSQQALLADRTYDPDNVSFFAFAVLKSQGQQVDVENLKTGGREIACVCRLEF